MAITASRRTFLKAGLAGTIILATAGGVYRATAGRAPPGKFILDAEGKAALGAIVGVVLQGALPADAQAIDVAIARTQETIAGLPLIVQKEIQDLFGLLVFAPTRRLLAGVPVRWADATPDDVTEFLQSWRMHRFAMLQSAYQALHDLILGGWYADESTWESIGYPGPMKVLS
ncbi:MAG: hypothetical protein A3I66_08420 [Burkholderiales bacterium RIFCSPLOWO2_02_FULL_57_36]|nr:MAG: hypothetical protein A3I66_08420 [Burkholderiales bacterium RIFCSPLOWO2_02_FULL_57_36]